MAGKKSTIQTPAKGGRKTSPETSNRNPTGVYKGTREEWLEAAMLIMGKWLNTLLHVKDIAIPTPRGMKRPKNPVLMSMAQIMSKIRSVSVKAFDFRPKTVAVSCSLQDTGMVASSALAHVHLKHATGNKMHEIRMGVHVGGQKTKARSCRVADILLHEMIHTCFPMDGHRGGFRALAVAVGLQNPMTATTASDALAQRIKKEVVNVLGKYPHKPVKLIPRGQRGKGSRSIKAQCEDCGCVIRISRTWIRIADDKNGGLICPLDDGAHGLMVVEGEY
jgi:hypothetical protein